MRFNLIVLNKIVFTIQFLFILVTGSFSQNDLKEEILIKASSFWEKSNEVFYKSLDSCEIYTRRASQLYLMANDMENYTKTLLGIYGIYYWKGEYSKQEAIIDSISYFSKKYLKRNSKIYINSLNSRAHFYRQIGNQNKAQDLFRKGINLCKSNINLKSNLYENLAITYLEAGDFYLAKKAVENAIVIKNIVLNKNDSRVPSLINTKVKILLRNKEYREALLYLVQIKKHKVMNRVDTNSIIISKLLESEILFELQELEQSYQVLKEVKKIIRPTERNYSDFILLYLKLLKSSSKYQEAIRLIKLNEPILLKNDINFRTELRLCYELVEIYLLLKDFEKCKEQVEIILEKLNQRFNDSHNLELVKLYLLCLRVPSINKESILKYTAPIIKSLRIQNSDASHKSFWANENLEFYQQAINIFINSEKPEEAFSFAEENKSNLLVESLNDCNAKGYAGVPEEVLDRERSQRGKLNFYTKELDKLKNEEEPDSSQLLSLGELVSRTQLELDALIDSLERNYPLYYELKYNEDSLSVADVQGLLDDETAFIEFFAGKDTSFVFTITKNSGVSIYGIEGLTYYQEELNQYYELLNDPGSDAEVLKLVSSRLYKNIFKNAIDLLPENIKNLVIVPDDILTNLPFELLKKDDQYLNSTYNISYQYSGRLWKMLKEKEQADYTYELTGFAYNTEQADYLAERSCFDNAPANLLCSEKEIQNILNIVGDDLISYESKEKVFDRASNSRVVHLATHSCLDTSNSDYSRIYFNDGYITNLELQNMNLGTELAVLSGCESGYGSLVKGEGAMSISKGFFHAGCKSTLVSLWPVDDCSTASIMEYFYKNLKEGQTKDAALNSAKLEYQQTAHPSRTHPYYWAGFIVLGDTAPIWGVGDFFFKIMLSSFLFVFIALIIIFKTRKVN